MKVELRQLLDGCRDSGGFPFASMKVMALVQGRCCETGVERDGAGLGAEVGDIDSTSLHPTMRGNSYFLSR